MNNRQGCFVLLTLLCLLSVSVVSAQSPSIRVNPVWRPASQLTSIDVNGDGDGVTDPGDDIRYVVADIYATVNVEFWAVGFTCTVNKNALESYVKFGDPNGTEDDVPIFDKGGDWTSVAEQAVDTTNVDGKFNFAIAVLGEYNPPMGGNGVTQTLHIASLKYRVKEGLAAATTSPFTCITSFLNRDGRAVLAAVYVAPPPLSIIPGYTLRGKVTYQGTTTPLTAIQAIDVLCDNSDADPFFNNVVTTANVTTGLFSVSNLRTQGRYDCQFIGNIRAPGVLPDLHLMSMTDFNLTTAAMNLLPVVLRSGNVDHVTVGSTIAVNNPDLTMVTSNWNAPLSVVTAPYLLGDASGDRKINEADLAVVASNYQRVEPIPSHHLIYSLPRDQNAFQNSRLWLGTLNNQTVTPFVSGATRDFWPALSPDGSRIAFVRSVVTAGLEKFALFTAPITNGVVGAATRITPATAAYDAFAPTWSPDGSQLAFVCSFNQDWVEPSALPGHLCLIDAGGLNFRHAFNLNGGKPIFTKVQPPAWAGSTHILVAYPAEPGAPTPCDNSLCLLAVSNYFLTNLVAIPAGSDFPVVRDTILGRTLFYRFDNGAGSRNIRYAVISTTTALPNANYPNATPTQLHGDAMEGQPFPFGAVISTTVDYFTVSTGADPDIWLYASNPASGNAGGTIFLTRVFDSVVPFDPMWSAVFLSSYTVADGVGNPAFASGYNAALRNTAAFVP